MQRLKKRSDFLKTARGAKQVRTALVLQARQHNKNRTYIQAEPRIGFTVTKKVGNAVVRNRVRRRLKEAVRLLDSVRPKTAKNPFLANTDYVVIGRMATVHLSFSRIQQDLKSAVLKVAQNMQPQSDSISR